MAELQGQGKEASDQPVEGSGEYGLEHGLSPDEAELEAAAGCSEYRYLNWNVPQLLLSRPASVGSSLTRLVCWFAQ
jgi:hypothetical protein